MGDPGSPPPPPPPPPITTGSGSGSSSTTATTKDTTPPKRAGDLKVTTPQPGAIALSWTLPPAPDIAHVIVARGRAGHCPTQPLHVIQIGGFDRRTTQVDKSERDTTRYCYAVFTLDAAGNWASPITILARNKGDTTPPAAVTGVTAVLGKSGAVKLVWTNPPGVAQNLVVRGHGSTCPVFPTDGTRIGDRAVRQSQVDSSVQTAPGTYCYGVYAFDKADNPSPIVTAVVEPAAPAAQSSGTPPPSQPGSSGSSLPDIVGIVGGGAIVLTGLAFVTLRLVRREWEWHSRTGYGIRDLMSVDVRDYDRQALVIPAIIGVCIAGAVVVLLLSL